MSSVLRFLPKPLLRLDHKREKPESAQSASADPSPKESVLTWFQHVSSRPARACAMVIHGLNLNPCRMNEIVSLLNDNDIDVMLLSLRAHAMRSDGRDSKSDQAKRLNAFKTVSYPGWREEVKTAYQELAARAQAQSCPVYLVAYSLGGLMGCDFLLHQPQPVFEKMVLFAPAIAPHRIRVPFLKTLYLFPRLVVPSLSPRHYRANRGTPIAAYLALLEAARSFKQRIDQRLNIPTLVFIDKKDELVSYGKLKKLIALHSLDQWQMVPIRRNPDQMAFPFHHLIIDARSAGEHFWQTITSKIVEHLVSSDSPSITSKME